jgi:hypothetical protein
MEGHLSSLAPVLALPLLARALSDVALYLAARSLVGTLDRAPRFSLGRLVSGRFVSGLWGELLFVAIDALSYGILPARGTPRLPLRCGAPGSAAGATVDVRPTRTPTPPPSERMFPGAPIWLRIEDAAGDYSDPEKSSPVRERTSLPNRCSAWMTREAAARCTRCVRSLESS